MKDIIINATQHMATAEQSNAGVVNMMDTAGLKGLLTFNELPSRTAVQSRAVVIAVMVKEEVLRHLQALPSSDPTIAAAQQLVAVGISAPLFSILHPKAMIGGAPYLMPALEKELIALGIEPVYSFSERVSEETVQADGSVVKTNVFKHVGFVSTW